MTDEIDLIRRLVEDNAKSRVTGKIPRHEAGKEPWPFDLDGKERCHCSFCSARQYLSWREEKVEDPASDEVEFAKVMP